MERAEAGFKDRPSGRFLHRPKVPHFIFHIYQSRPFPIDPRLLSKEELRPVEEALRYVDKLGRSANRSAADEIAYGRVGAFIDNYVKMVLECKESYSPVVIACGTSGSFNTFFATEAIGIKEGILPLMREEAEAIARARRAYGGGMYRAQISNTADQEVREQILEKMQNFRNQGFYVSDENQNVLYLGRPDGYPEYNLSYLRHESTKTQFSMLTDEAPLHTPLMEPYAADLQKILDRIRLKLPKTPVIRGDGRPIESIDDIKQAIIREVTAPSDLKAIKTALGRWGITERELHHVGLDRVEEDNQHLGISAIILGALGLTVVSSVFVVREVIKHQKSKKD